MYKRELRQKSKDFRRNLSIEEKLTKDTAVFQRIISLRQYRGAKMLICYVSTDIEVDTHALINHALSCGKRVVVPRCVEGTRLMEFYEIRSLEELERGTFGVLEPPPNPARLVTRFDRSICIVPALVYDLQGHRLGYGSGYYDRFLSGYEDFKVGVTYTECVRRHLQHGRFDVPVDLLVTDRYLRFTNRQRKPSGKS